MVIPQDSLPVSYTHLDVYKRQLYTLDQYDNQRGQCSVNKNHDLSFNGELVLEFIGQEIHNLALRTNACQLGIPDLVEHIGTDHANDEKS